MKFQHNPWLCRLVAFSAAGYAANDTNPVGENMKPRYLIDPDELDLDMDALIGSAQTGQRTPEGFGA